MKKSRRRPPKAQTRLTSEQMAIISAQAAQDLKAQEIVILEVGELLNYSDYFVIASARSTRQAQSIADNVQRTITASGERILGVEGQRDGNWILIDAGEVIVHVFYHPVREFYELEKLWGDAKRLSWPGP